MAHQKNYQRTILVTGGAGNIGGALASRLVQDPENYVVIVDDLSTGSVGKLPVQHHGNCRFVKLNCNNFGALSSVMTSTAFDYVFHYAAVVGVERTLNNPLAVLGDIDGIRNVLDLAKNTGVRRVFYSSSSEVYGEPVEFPQNEATTPLNSRLPYAIVKNVGESFFRSYHREFGLPYTIFRFFNTYGPRQSEDFVLPKFIVAALAGASLKIYGDGSQTRTFCYIDDNSEATVKALYDNMLVDETVNLGSDREITILELAKMVKDRTRSKSEIVHLPPLPEGDMTRRCPDIAKMRALLGRDLTPLEAGMDKLIESKRQSS
jgi:UDP-glucuronate decarboxylase